MNGEARVLGDLVARGRRSEAPALRAPASGREYDYRRLCTNAWKVGNFLRHLGVRGGCGVAVAAEPTPEPVLALFGAALLGGVTRYVPLGAGRTGHDHDHDHDLPDGVRAVVAPVDGLGAAPGRPGRERVVYGGAPDDPAVAHFERDVWSENPTEPPDRVDADDPALRAAGSEYDHASLLEAGREAADRWSLSPGEAVAVRAPLTHPGTVAAGVVAPLLEGGVVVLAGDGPTTADRAVVAGAGPDDPDPPESRVLAPGSLLE